MTKTKVKTFLGEVFKVTRLQSLAWRSGAFLAVGLISIISENLGILELNVQVQIVVALVLSEITKALNNYLSK
jgi:hypothetical protein